MVGTKTALDRETQLWRHAVGAHQRLRFLNEASRVLGETLDPQDVLRRVASLAVPKVADWCLIDLLDEQGELRLEVVVDSDPGKEALLRRLRREFPLEERHPIREAVREGRAQLVPRVADRLRRSPAHRRLLRRLDSGAYVCVPLSAGGRPIGALSFGRSGGLALNSADLELGRELGLRAGVAIENARLYRKARDADDMLSRALSANNMVAWSWNRRTGEIYRSPNAAEVYGFEPGASFGRGFDLVHSEDRARYKAAIERAVAENGSIKERFRIVRSDGSVAWMEEHASMAGDRLSGVVMDITTRKLAEDEIRLEEEVARIVAEAPDVDEAMPRLLGAVGRLMSWSLGFAWRAAGPGALSYSGQWASSDMRGGRRISIRASAGPFPRSVLATGQASWVCGMRPGETSARQTCAFAFPILGADRVLAVLEFYGDGTAISEGRRAELFARLGRQIGTLLERKGAEAALERQRREQQLILDAVPAMIWYKDERNVMLRCNPAAARWLERFPGGAEECHRDEQEVLRTGKAKLGVIEERVAPGGQRCWVRRDILPHGSSVVVFAVDITEIKRAEAALRDSERAQRDFVANVSHEFRTPVAAIKGFAETLRRGGLEDRKNRLGFVRTIESHADRLDWLVQDLLNLARLGEGMVQLKKTPLPVKKFLEDYLASVASITQRRAVSVEVHAPSRLVALADRPHLVQVLDNLLSNALKHSPKGSIVRLEGRREGRGVLLTVRDQGCGIEAEHLPRLFDRFFRVQKGDGGGSTGLGLHIVKTIVEAQGGKVWAESQPGRGSAFHLTLPRAA